MEPHFNPIEEENWKKFEIFVLFTGSLIGFPGGTVVKNPPVNAEDTGDLGSISGLERSPRRENGNPFQYSCLENFMDREAWQATVLGVTKSRT